MNSHSKIHTCKSSFSDFRSFMIATLLANDVFASSASASKLFFVANSVAMSVRSCFTIPCSQEVLREESLIACQTSISARNSPFVQLKKLFLAPYFCGWLFHVFIDQKREKIDFLYNLPFARESSSGEKNVFNVKVFFFGQNRASCWTMWKCFSGLLHFSTSESLTVCFFI